jgi:hypothetical protein
LASWKGLLADGIERCVLVGQPPAAEGWAERLRADLESADLDDLLSVAERENPRPVAAECRRRSRAHLDAALLPAFQTS